MLCVTSPLAHCCNITQLQTAAVQIRLTSAVQYRTDFANLFLYGRWCVAAG
jgi:hypothetical protein